MRWFLGLFLFLFLLMVWSGVLSLGLDGELSIFALCVALAAAFSLGILAMFSLKDENGP